MAALDDLTGLLANLPNADMLSEKQKQDALAGALVPDGLGVWPGKPGYQETFDIYWAALSLLGFLAAQPIVTASASEGTSVTVSAPSWGGLAAYYRNLSPIARASTGAVLRSIPIPATPHVTRVDMSDEDWKGRRASYGDVNTSA